MNVRFNYPYCSDNAISVKAGECLELITLTNTQAEFKQFEMPLNLFFKITEPVKEKVKTVKSSLSPNRVIELYNEILSDTNARQKRMVDNGLKTSIKARISQLPTEQGWIDLLEGLKNSHFLMGQVQSGDRKPFQLSIEWLVKPANFSKVLDGYYHGK